MPSRATGKASYDHVPDGWTDWRAAFENPGTLPGVTGGTYDYFDTPFNLNGRVSTYTGRYQSDVIGDFSVDMARRFSRHDAPFFMYVNYVAPHHGAPVEPEDPGAVLDSDGDVMDRYRPDGLADDHGDEAAFMTPARPERIKGRWNDLVDGPAGMPREGGPAERDVSDKPRILRGRPEPNAVERRALTTLTRQRAEAITVMDRQVARLVKQLKASGEWADTVLMFTSDNGYFLGEHRVRFGKLLPQEASLRVPFLVTGPGMRSGDVRHDPVTTVDVSASILDLAEARAPRPADGASKVATMLEGDSGWDVPIVTESMHTSRGSRPGMGPFGGLGLRTARYSFTQYRDGDVELYDLLRDPLQNHNVAGSPSYAVTERALRRTWTRFKSCRAKGCVMPMSVSLHADPEQEAHLSAHYRESVADVYGFH